MATEVYLARPIQEHDAAQALAIDGTDLMQEYREAERTSGATVYFDASQGPRLSVVIPTYQRERVLIDAIRYLLNLRPGPAEILVIDQTAQHEPDTRRALAEFDSAGKIRWIRLPSPSITHAMNVGLQEARQEIVLFLDDDIIPDMNLISTHLLAHQHHNLVAGQVLQPGEQPLPDHPGDRFRFCSSRRQEISEIMGGNFSIKRALAVGLGGFDENFVQVAYRFEAEFAERALAAGERILFEPAASIRHLKDERGGTRAYGQHLTTIRPGHSVGAYYFLLRSRNVSRRMLHLLSRPLRSVRTKHHATHPWWIPATLAAELMGFIWAVFLFLRGPRLLGPANNLGKQI